MPHSLEKLVVGDNVTVALFINARANREACIGLWLEADNFHDPGPVVPARALARDHGLDGCGALAVFDDVVIQVTKAQRVVLGCGLRFSRDRGYQHAGPGPRDSRLFCAKRIGPPPIRLVIQRCGESDIDRAHASVLCDLLVEMGEPEAAALVRPGKRE
jgi:hypothetical protein